MLDQERCILCSRCVRFTDEISKTGEFGIFNRGDRAEVGLVPGQELTNPYSGNVIDVCPVGALTERDFRFKARVWYLSSASTVCNACARGCNIDVHYLLDRPHLNDGARVLRIKPRYNTDVNQWWMCDEGRFGFHWIDRGRLTQVRHRGRESTWQDALADISGALRPPHAGRPSPEGSPQGRIGVIASSKLSNEALFLIREIFQRALGVRVAAAVSTPSGYSDDFLIQADKTPNTFGATLLELAGPAPAAAALVSDALHGEIQTLWVLGQDLVELGIEAPLEELSQRLDLFVYSGTNEGPTADAAHWTLPAAAYLEEDGTFVNCNGRVQRIGRAFPPLPDSRETWKILLDLAQRLGLEPAWRNPQDIFTAMTKVVVPLAGLTYQTIGSQGVSLNARPERVPEPREP
jgi:NADH-quinone oxidoreductase subunit G